jgi:hypothetical protein
MLAMMSKRLLRHISRTCFRPNLSHCGDNKKLKKINTSIDWLFCFGVNIVASALVSIFMETRQTSTERNNDGQNMTVTPKAYTIPEAACQLRMSEKSVRRQIDRKRLRRCQGYGRILIPAKDVDNFFDKFSA